MAVCPMGPYNPPMGLPGSPTLQSWKNDRRLCCLQGAGIVWATSIGRLELNVCQVLRRGEFDRVKRGLQFGFSAPL